MDIIGDALIDLQLRPVPDTETIAHAVFDIVEASFKISNELLPGFIDQGLAKETRKDFFLNIMDELRHIAYHIDDLRVSGEGI
jgi:hypothetical protein